MHSGTLLVAYVALQRLFELIVAQKHTRALIARGAYEAGASHYPVMVALHASWLMTLAVFGWNHSINVGFFAFFVVLQIARFWVLGTRS